MTSLIYVKSTLGSRCKNMSDMITSSNLDQIIDTNKSIKEEINLMINNLEIRYNTSGISNKENLALKILKDNHLIQIPIETKHWGGAVFVRGDMKIPILNSAQPRIYQYFIAWHEVYHLLYDTNLSAEIHNISVDMSINERKADYFAASVLLGNVYDYYYSLEDEDFISRIIRCMDLYKAPYKAVLIHLYEKAVTQYNDKKIKKLIHEHFDQKPSDLVEKFDLLELDSGLVKATNIISFSGLERLITKKISENPDTTYHNTNLEFLMQLKQRISELSRRV